MKQQLPLSLALFAASALSSHAQANTWSIDSNHTQATFEVRHLMVSNVRGAISNATGTVLWYPKDPTKDSVNAVLSATTLNSGSDYRDKDLKGADWFNVEKFPSIVFKSSSVNAVASGLKVAGELTLAGVTRSVVLDVTNPPTPQKGMQGGLVTGMEATTIIKRTDFNFGTKYPNAVVSDEVKITIDLEMDQK